MSDLALSIGGAVALLGGLVLAIVKIFGSGKKAGAADEREKQVAADTAARDRIKEAVHNAPTDADAARAALDERVRKSQRP